MPEDLHHIVDVYGLGYVSVHSAGTGLSDILGKSVGRHGYYRQFCKGRVIQRPNAPCGLKTVHNGHHHIHYGAVNLIVFRELNRLRVEARRRKAEAARAEALAAAEALRAERAREAAERKAAEEEAAAEKAEAEKAHRAAVVAALAQGYDVDVDFELTEEEAAQLKEAGFDVPEEDAE